MRTGERDMRHMLAFRLVANPEPQAQTRTQFTRETILEDYRVAFRSRQASLIGRKEVPQLAMARAFRSSR